jgi:hypothetical protein
MSDLAREIVEAVNGVIWPKTCRLDPAERDMATKIIAAKLAEANAARDERDARARELIEKVRRHTLAPEDQMRLDQALALLQPKGGDDGD